MSRYTFKKLKKELDVHFGTDNVVFTDRNGVKTIKFGKLVYPEDSNNNTRVFEINNNFEFEIKVYKRIGSYVKFNRNSYRTFAALANSFINDIDRYKKINDDFVQTATKMVRYNDDDDQELISCLLTLKLEGKFDELYEVFKYRLFDEYNSGYACFRTTENNSFENAKQHIVSIQKWYEQNKKIDFVEQFNLDLKELAESILKIMFKSHVDGLYKRKYRYWILKSPEEIAKTIDEYNGVVA